MSDKKKNHAFVLLDETGSMRGQEKRVCTSMNEYVGTLPKGTNLTVFKFDSKRFTTLYSGPTKDWQEMTPEDYRPGAMTPLFDSIARVIEHAKKYTSKDDRVLVMIDTDGYENMSSDHTLETVKGLIERRKAKGWKFLFMASGLTEADARNVGTTGASLGTQVISDSYALRSRAYASAGAQTVSHFRDEDTAQ